MNARKDIAQLVARATQGVSYAVARKWYREGTLPIPARKVGGLVLVGDVAGKDDSSAGQAGSLPPQGESAA
ncbi:MAG: hypothetical protein QG622_3683 [Actinomycetota bacterium]|nr:hypothetical protein [Actinomycetota bacterium]